MHARQVLPAPRALRVWRRARRQGRRGDGGDARGGPTRQAAQGTKRHEPPVQAQAHAGGGGGGTRATRGDETHLRRARHPAKLPRPAGGQTAKREEGGATQTDRARGVQRPAPCALRVRGLHVGVVGEDGGSVRGGEDRVARRRRRGEPMGRSAGFDRIVRAPRARLRAVRRRVRDRGWGERGASEAQPGTARFGRVCSSRRWIRLGGRWRRRTAAAAPVRRGTRRARRA